MTRPDATERPDAGTCTTAPPRRRPRHVVARRGRCDERGAVAGAEGLAVGVLVLVAGTVLVVNLWSVLATRSALDAGAREYLRTWTSAPSASSAPLLAESALRRSLDGSGRTALRPVVDGPDPSRFGPCADATVELRAQVPAMRAPFLGTLASVGVTVRHSDLVEPHREVSSGDRYDPDTTPCAG